MTLSRPKLAVLSDFDGTLTAMNVMDSLYEEFGGPSRRRLMERWRRGEISTMEEIEGVFRTVKASRMVMESYLHTVQLDPDFLELLSLCRRSDIFFAIVSDGFRWYIDYILERHGVRDVPVYAGDIIVLEDGLKFDFPWYDPAYPLRSTAKPQIVRDFQRRGFRVLFIGDGLSDVEVLQVADQIYAKDVLLQHARQDGADVREFNTLGEVYSDLSRLVGDGRS